MPLLDHFHAPLFPRHSWSSFHSNWATRLADALSKRLPPEFQVEQNTRGGGRLEIRLDDPSRADLAVGALASMSDEPPVADGDLVTVGVRGRAGAIVEAVRRLDGAGVGVEDIALRRPTLDDVFLALTGHAAEADQDEQVAA